VRIERFEIVPYALEFEQPYVTARGHLERRELVLVRVHAEGLVGLGETAALVLRGGDPLARIVADLERCSQLLERTDLEPRRWADPMARLRPGVATPATAAVEIALLDLAGKAAGEPAWRVLGAKEAAPLECNATLTAGTPDDVARQALEWAARSFETFKLKVGIEGDVEQVGAAREALGPEATLRVDANGAWTVDEAAERLAAMGPLELAEQPVATLEEMALLRDRVDTPLAADESVASPAEARTALASGACSLATVKLAKVGGPAAALAVAAEIPSYLSSSLDGPIGIAAAAHTGQALPPTGLAHGLATSVLFDGTVASKECRLRGPYLSVPDGPGLGVEIDEHALAARRI
jgi:L-Ala-D/L-Glu epimerase / N-acetyl-D-glutamate racemase